MVRPEAEGAGESKPLPAVALSLPREMKRRKRSPDSWGRIWALLGCEGGAARRDLNRVQDGTQPSRSLGRWPVKQLSISFLLSKRVEVTVFLSRFDEQILGGRSHHRNRCYLKQMSLINLKSGGVFTRLHIQGRRESVVWWGEGRCGWGARLQCSGRG